MQRSSPNSHGIEDPSAHVGSSGVGIRVGSAGAKLLPTAWRLI